MIEFCLIIGYLYKGTNILFMKNHFHIKTYVTYLLYIEFRVPYKMG